MKGGLVPPWLGLLLTTQFFTTCSIHIFSALNECNLFCIDCHEAPLASFCYHCRSCDHSSHRVIQVRRSPFQDVVRVAELEDILDISDVQTYVVNSATVVYLNERPHLKGSAISAVKASPSSSSSSSSSSSHNCETCNRALLDEFRFCSLGCNLKGVKNGMETKLVDGNGLDDIEKNRETGYNNGSANTESGKESFSDDDCCKEIPPPTRVPRHHRWKGIPCRAPFF